MHWTGRAAVLDPCTEGWALLHASPQKPWQRQRGCCGPGMRRAPPCSLHACYLEGAGPGRAGPTGRVGGGRPGTSWCIMDICVQTRRSTPSNRTRSVHRTICGLRRTVQSVVGVLEPPRQLSPAPPTTSRLSPAPPPATHPRLLARVGVRTRDGAVGDGHRPRNARDPSRALQSLPAVPAFDTRLWRQHVLACTTLLHASKTPRCRAASPPTKKHTCTHNERTTYMPSAAAAAAACHRPAHCWPHCPCCWGGGGGTP